MVFSEIMELSDSKKIDYLIKSDKELELWQKIELIGSLKDEKLKVDCIKNPDIKLESYDKASIISSIKDKRINIGMFDKSKYWIKFF